MGKKKFASDDIPFPLDHDPRTPDELTQVFKWMFPRDRIEHFQTTRVPFLDLIPKESK